MNSSSRKHPLAECEICPLADRACAPTEGPKDARIAVVSRSPGYYDAKAGRPFSGPSGQVLDYLLQRYGVKRNEVLTTNVVLCETDAPSNEAIKACSARLTSELSNAGTIIAAGSEAASALTRVRSVHAGRGAVHRRTTNEGLIQRVVVTNNPALVLRKSDAFPDLLVDFRMALDPIPEPQFPTVEVINDPTIARGILRTWNDTEFDIPIAADLEWRNNTEYVCAGFSKDGIKAVVFGWGSFDQGNRELLGRFFNRSDIRFIWHNGKADTKVLRSNGIQARVDEDTLLLSYALDEEPGRHALEYLLQTEFGWPDYEPSSVKQFKKTGVFSGATAEEMAKSERELYLYNGWDAAGTKQLYDLFVDRAKEDNVYEKPYKLVMLPASESVRTMEMRGFHFDAEEACNLNEREVLPRLWGLEEQIREVSGRALLNPRSTQQMKAVYYEDFGLVHNLKDSGKKKLQGSTGAEIRKEIEDGRFKSKAQFKDRLVKLAELHQEFAEIDKQRSTYIESLIEKVDTDGRVYSTFNIAGTVTARFSSKEPNFQNITREGRRGIQGIRTLFRPSDGCSIVQADFSQAELRTCAVLSGDKNLLAIYRDSQRSLHKERAAAFYGNNYTYEEYVKSKNINFGVTYGQSAQAFAQMYHMDEDEAQAYIDSWWNEFPQLRNWVKSVWREAQTSGFIRSPFGHKRRFHLITKENLNDVLREAVNFLPQNIAGNLTICALNNLVDVGVPVISTVHDSILADVPSDEVHSIALTMKNVMEKQAKEKLGWDLPFLVDVSVSDENWASVKEMEIAA